MDNDVAPSEISPLLEVRVWVEYLGILLIPQTTCLSFSPTIGIPISLFQTGGEIIVEQDVCKKMPRSSRTYLHKFQSGSRSPEK